MSMRISGLASGMDIEQIISDLMEAQRIPLDKMNQNKQVLEWQQEDYRSINTQLAAFREKVLELRLSSTFNAKAATSSNENVVTATASSSAVEGANSIAVTQLAEGAYKTSSASLESGEDISTLSAQFGLTGSITFSINDTEFTIDADNESIYNLAQKINSANIGVKASYDKNLDRFFLSTTKTGSEAQIAISGGDSLFDKLKIDTSEVAEGKDAKIILNGTNFDMASNEFAINGVTYTLKGISAVGSDEKPVSTVVSVKSDTEQIFQTIMDFVDLYNETIGKINSELNETYYKDYQPLTDAEREQLDDDQIEKWTERAKSGLLKNDTILKGIVSGFRYEVYGFVEGLSSSCNSLADLGITTGTYTEQGRLHVDQDALRKAIEEDPEAVQKLFTATSNDGNDANEGIAVRLYKATVNAISSVTEKAGAESASTKVDNSVIGKRIKDIDDRIDTLEDRLQMIENRYWTQFTAMETAINNMNSQSSWLSSLLGNNSQ